MTTQVNTITPLTTPAPNRGMSEAVFAPAADVFAAEITDLVPNLNSRIGEINTLAGELNALGLITMPMKFSTTTADADPGQGYVRLGSAPQNTANVARMDLLDVNGADISALLASFGSGTSTIKGMLVIADALTPTTKFLKFNVTAVASPAGYKNITVACVAFSAASPFANDDNIVVTFVRGGDAGGITQANYQNQDFISGTTGGTGTAYTLTPSAPIAAYAAPQSFMVTFHAASGASPTLQISGVAAPPNLVRQLADGTYTNIAAGEIPANHRSHVILLSAAQALVESLPFAPGSKIGVQVFTATGTYTPTPGTKWIEVEVQAPGGGSGGAAATAAGQMGMGAGGAGGGYGRKKITSGFSGATVTIGAVGAAGAAGVNAGGTGGTTSFGAFLSCTGGAGGAGGNAGTMPTVATLGFAAGGVATGADYHRPGSPGRGGWAPSTINALTGQGGDAFYGAGGASQGIQSNNASGATPSGYGGGGGGPANVNGSFAAIAGIAGGPGIVIVHEYA